MMPKQNVVLPKYYANYNKSMPKEYWDYENAVIEWGYK